MSLKTLVDIAGKPMLARVIATVSAVAPGAPYSVALPWSSVRRLLAGGGAGGGGGALAAPGALPGAERRGLWSQAEAEGCALLLTTGDHPPHSRDPSRLLGGGGQGDHEVAVGLASYPAVRAAFPDSRPLSDGAYCGTNLFYFRGGRAGGVLPFGVVEALRKRPGKMLRTLGLGLAARYLAGRLSDFRPRSLTSARGRCAEPCPWTSDAAVDVDSLEDLATVRARFAARAAS